MIDTKINKINVRNFQKSVSWTEHKKRFENLDFTNLQNITLQFTDLMCGKIAYEIKNLIRKIHTNFEYYLSFTNIKLKNFIGAPFKPQISKKLK